VPPRVEHRQDVAHQLLRSQIARKKRQPQKQLRNETHAGSSLHSALILCTRLQALSLHNMARLSARDCQSSCQSTPARRGMMQMAIAAPRCLLPPNQAALSKQLYGATGCLRLEPTRLRAGGRAAADVGFPPSTANKAAVPVDPRILTIARGC